MPPDRRALLEGLPGWTWDAFDEKWEKRYLRLREYAAVHKTCYLPFGYTDQDGFMLQQWVDVQRRRKNKLSGDFVNRLESLPGWSWRSAIEDQWERGYERLNAYVAVTNNAAVPKSYLCEDGFKLGAWVGTQRSNKNRLSEQSRRKLEALPGWSWDALSDKWEDGFRYLKKFADREGHAKVPLRYKTEGGYALGQWVRTQRKTKDNISSERKARLEALSSWSWDVKAEQWEEGFRCLKEFVEREGRANVPQQYKTADGYQVGEWVATQRKSKDSMSPARKARLDALPGWIWRVK